MNRLILIGNGFDLAHKMKTSYYDFILWYLKKVCKASQERTYNDELVEVERIHSVPFTADLDSIISLKRFLEFIRDPSQNTNEPYVLFIKTDFIRNLMITCSEYNWIDIEQQYYLEVLNTLRGNFDQSEKHSIIKKLNDDLEYLKNQLKEYITTQVVNKDFDFLLSPYGDEITRGINYSDEANLTSADIDKIEELITEGKIKETSKGKITPQSTMFLNFNYTNTIENYLNNSFIISRLGYSPFINNIHGSAKTEIIFGFGDEVDDEYINLEKQNDNEFLRHIKSFYYFKSQDYKDLIRFIESDNYEVYIWGHSCGLSDRTLLNMIYQNQKCKSIKIFHHKKSEEINNYTQLTQEISRHFRDKQLMRKLIVPFDANNYMHQY